MAVALSVAFAASGETLPVASAAHPAVVRIVAPEEGAVSYGSGALVAVTEFYGLVVTNWHVIRDAQGPLFVEFPGGFRSAARALKIDRSWDLAALAIWRPPVGPIPVATEAPRPGQRLTIAGYGKGWYRAMSGRCTQYVSPGGNHPFEMVELSAPARDGDSGGPIFNDRGEIAGILFGSAFGRTTGSYCGRLRWFLSGVRDDFYNIPAPAETLYAQQPPGGSPAANSSPSSSSAVASVRSAPKGQDLLPVPPVVSIAASPLKSPPKGTFQTQSASSSALPATSVSASPNPAMTTSVVATASEGGGWYDPLRNFLAVVGIVAVALQGLRFLASATK